jgi:hypothetical protein
MLGSSSFSRLSANGKLCTIRPVATIRQKIPKSARVRWRSFALMFIRSYARRVPAGPERHSVLFAKGAVFVLDGIPLLLLGDEPGVRKGVKDGIEEEERADSGSGPRGAIAPIADPRQGASRGPL